MTVYQQATTGTLHLEENCSVTRRTRYRHFRIEVVDREPEPYTNEMSREQVAAIPHCHKCWDGKREEVEER